MARPDRESPPAGAPDPDAGAPPPPFAVTLTRVLLVQVIALVALWLLQSRYPR
ncbi:MAG: hypothetical protein R2909_09575 [Gemmatimonadales bacterium]